jgi:hypothetical protein
MMPDQGLHASVLISMGDAFKWIQGEDLVHGVELVQYRSRGLVLFAGFPHVSLLSKLQHCSQLSARV